MQTWYGIDIGGTKIEAAARDAALNVHYRQRVAMPTSDYAAFVAAGGQLVDDADAALGTRSVAIGP